MHQVKKDVSSRNLCCHLGFFMLPIFHTLVFRGCTFIFSIFFSHGSSCCWFSCSRSCRSGRSIFIDDHLIRGTSGTHFLLLWCPVVSTASLPLVLRVGIFVLVRYTFVGSTDRHTLIGGLGGVVFCFVSVVRYSVVHYGL